MNRYSAKVLIFLLVFFISASCFAKTNLEKTTQQKNLYQPAELPSLELLLYLGEFQDKDGSLLEPEKFDETLKLDETEQVITDESTHNETNTPQVTEIKKEDDDE